MKYSVSGRQPARILDKADEIYMEQRDYLKIQDYIIDYPDKDIVLNINHLGADWDELGVYAKKHENFYVALDSMAWVQFCQERDIKYFYSKPIDNYFSFNKLKNLDVSQIIITGEILFDTEMAAMKDIPLRACANDANGIDDIKISDGICGPFIRPEDMDLYEDTLHMIFFKHDSLSQEKALLEIYKEDKKWIGNLRHIIPTTYVNVNNVLIREEFGKKRFGCRQRCMRNEICTFCQRALTFANKVHDEIRKEGI